MHRINADLKSQTFKSSAFIHKHTNTHVNKLNSCVKYKFLMVVAHLAFRAEFINQPKKHKRSFLFLKFNLIEEAVIEKEEAVDLAVAVVLSHRGRTDAFGCCGNCWFGIASP